MAAPAFGKRFSTTGRTVIGPRDEVYAGVPLGVIPTNAAAAETRRATRDDVSAPIAVRFDPPKGVWPEQTGMLRYAEVARSDEAAALIAMAVERRIAIDQRHVPGARGALGTEWVLEPAQDGKEGLGFFREAVFDSVANAVPNSLQGVGRELARRLTIPRSVLRRSRAHVEWYPTLHPEHGTFPIRGARTRSALGSALRYQLAGFHEFLATADGSRLRFEEGAAIFSRHLPWAIALGVAQQWAAALQEAARGLDDAYAGLWLTDLAWIGLFTMDGLAGLGAAVGDLAGGIGDFVGDLGGGFDGGGFDGGGVDTGGGDFGGGDFGGFG